MNTDLERILKQLEQATSHASIDPSELDLETRQLREGWLALDRLLQPSERHVALRAAGAANTLRHVRVNWTIVVSAVLLLGFCGSSVFISNIRLRVSDAAHAANSGTANGMIERSSASEHQSTELAWDDAFDNQLAAARAALRQTGDEQEIRQWLYLHGEFREINDEMTNSSL
jgi:hypothetical protein